MDIQLKNIPVRRNHANRYLTLITLADVSEWLGEPVTVIYTNNMSPGAVAGNRYHQKKREVFRAAEGRLEVQLVDVESGDRRVAFLDADPDSPDFVMLVVPPGVAHAVRNVGERVARLDVYATDEPRKPEDDFHYDVMPV